MFETIDGQLYLSLHLHQNDSDGSGTGGWRCPSIIALREEGQHGSVKLVLGLDSDKYAIKTAGTTWQVAKNFSSAGISFTARLDNNVVMGVKLTNASGGVNAVTIDKSGNIYVNNVKTASVEASDKYSFELNVKSDMSVFTLTINGSDVSASVVSAIGNRAVKSIEFWSTARDWSKGGQAAYSRLAFEVAV